VTVPELIEQDEQYAIVHRISDDGKVLAEQRIYEEPFWFLLKSVDGKLEGVFRKGMNMKHLVKWQNPDNETHSVWRRKGEVKFNLVHVTPRLRQNSISSVCTDSTNHTVGDSVATARLSSNDNTLHIRPELGPPSLNGSSTHPYSVNEKVQWNSIRMGLGAPSVKSEWSHEEFFKNIKAHCSLNPILFKKVIDWSMRKNKKRKISNDEAKKIWEGRVWVIAHNLDTVEGKATQQSLDEIKGAYQEVSEGVWMQPDPKACGSLVQHRLQKDEHGLWMIEQHRVEGEGWQIRVQQVETSKWVDLKNTKQRIHAYVVPMRRILEKLHEELLESKVDVKKSVDFLFNSCNQLKLCKLKGRNLKHHIANLRVKLDKRNALSLGVQVAATAESMIQEEVIFNVE